MTATINIDGRKVESDRVAKNRQSMDMVWVKLALETSQDQG
jgi:hypothetical protein